MYKIPKFNKTSIEVNKSVIGETIETKVERKLLKEENLKIKILPLMMWWKK